jgi:hypothetical protein
MQRKKQVGECQVCFIFFARVIVFSSLKDFFSLGNVLHFFLVFCIASIFVSIVGQFFGTWFFADGFLFLVKELGLLTNLGHWVRFLDATGSYMYIVL